MTKNEELALVIRLACLTEDRTDAEQRALISYAWRCDIDHNADTVENRGRGPRSKPGFELQDLVTEVVETREPGQRGGGLPKGWADRWAKSWRSPRSEPHPRILDDLDHGE